LIRYWLTPAHEESFDEKVKDVCELYEAAPALALEGERTLSTDEMSGIQALERTHHSESLVRWVAEISGCHQELGLKGEEGTLKNQASRAAFLADPTHKVVFHYTPKHASWLNQIEIWLGILVEKLLKRGSFTSVADLQEKILQFIGYYNVTMAKPFKWTYKGRVLCI
jgi:transposase